jgi:hypothetical protein
MAGLNPNTTYFYRVRETKGSQSSVWSNSVPVTTKPSSQDVSLSIPPAPLQYTPQLPDSNSFLLAFLVSDTTSEIRVDISISNTFSSYVYTELIFTEDDFSQLILSDGTIVNTVRVTGLSNSTLYYARLKGVNSAGTSAYSNSSSLRTLGLNIPPVLLPATDVGSTVLTVNWELTSATDYLVELSTSDTFTSSTGQVSATDSTTYTGLTPDTEYFIRVTSRPNGTVSERRSYSR